MAETGSVGRSPKQQQFDYFRQRHQQLDIQRMRHLIDQQEFDRRNGKRPCSVHNPARITVFSEHSTLSTQHCGCAWPRLP